MKRFPQKKHPTDVEVLTVGRDKNRTVAFVEVPQKSRSAPHRAPDAGFHGPPGRRGRPPRLHT